MSCRETPGNSAATSLAKFLTRAEEGHVSRAFHEVRSQAMATMGLDTDGRKVGKEPANVEEVQDFLDQLRLLARHDPRVPDVRRDNLLSRVEEAEAQLASGEGPNKATFYAWAHLVERLEQEPLAAKHGKGAVLEVDPTAGTTQEGLIISASDVKLAQAEYDRLRTNFVDHCNLTSNNMNFKQKEDRKFRSLELASARERFQRLSDAYDATDTGYESLLAEDAADAAHSRHTEWLARKDQADTHRSRVSPVAAAKMAAAQTSVTGAYEDRTRAYEAVKSVENAYRQSPNARARARYDAAVKEYQMNQRVYLYALGSRTDVAAAVAQHDLKSPQTWGSLVADANVSRLDLWRAVDRHVTDTDSAEVAIGRISEVEFIRRALSRAEARQAVLDAEGRGEVDQINRRFAESLRRKRGERAPSTNGTSR